MKWGWLLTALALAAFLVIRRRKLGRATQAAGWLATAVAAAIGVGAIPLPNIEELFLDVGRALGGWTYLVVGVLAFLETGAFVGLVAPGETAVIVGGVVAGQGEISLWVLIAIVWTCAVAGDVTSYTAGRKLGRAWLLRHGDRLKITEPRLKQVEQFFERRGGITILIGRFIGFVRALAPFIAGTSGMPLRRFLPYDILGAGAWAATFSTLGFVFWHSFDKLTTYVSRGLFAFGTVVALVVALVLLVRLQRDPALRVRAGAWLDERAKDNRFWSWVRRVAGPTWRLVGRPASGSS
jgi:membrane protein DedA with SNARE-associated domain